MLHHSQSTGASTATPLIALHGAGIRRDGRWLVRHVDLAVHPGEIVTLIGPNGSGKSTTVKMALGVLSPSEGRVEKSRRLKVGYVPQKLNIDWTLPLTVNRFMRLTARPDRNAIEEALQRVGIAHLAGADVQQLSGGEFQRVQLARAIALKPDLLVLDEPVQGVDFSGEIALYELISEIRQALGCGVLLISHDLHVVMAATDSVICLNGHVCCRGTPNTVAASSEYRQLFGERAAAALALYEHHHDHTHLPDGSIESGSDGAHACGHHHEPNNVRDGTDVKEESENA